ncbi:hypothetical protein I5Q34_29765 [Streptomyces sp. AV19]|uniref:hypothetical protein n=1 Tax=Streptomyces sp. AV19 TaxID=2793068 RepID=UPI0018FF03E6|nr:hypothetical protein [Streptomyces sp. AV19]MBH1938395.1 hypothetical protein [Streptomyces sp. AV19]MDG4535044.1 hypothetical protein [Streptomyces sp. AV19]
MLSAQAELVWQGRIHLGDEPGVYGDASYAGLTVELPLTVERLATTGPLTTTLVLETQDLRTFQGYPGHLLEVFLFAPASAPQRFTRKLLASTRLTGSGTQHSLAVDFTGHQAPHRLGVRLGVDTDVPPGLYDDFVLTRLSNRATDYAYVASFGFRA